LGADYRNTLTIITSIKHQQQQQQQPRQQQPQQNQRTQQLEHNDVNNDDQDSNVAGNQRHRVNGKKYIDIANLNRFTTYIEDWLISFVRGGKWGTRAISIKNRSTSLDISDSLAEGCRL
jgi:hypothetical protein